MKSNLHKLLLIFLVVSILIIGSTSSAKKTTSENGEEDRKIDDEKSGFKIASSDSFDKVKGLEACGNGDEECLMRRAVLEAHIDYIYTQKSVP